MGYNRSNRDPDVEKLLNELKSNQAEIFRFMREQFDSMSDEGEIVVFDEHEEEVGNLASEKFNISGEEAIELYQKISLKISDMHQERLRNN